MRSAITKTAALITLGAALILLAAGAQAHPGHVGGHDSASMFVLGFVHPLTGIDHLLAMLAVGVWSALIHKTVRNAVWLPAAFAALLLVGAALGLAGVTPPAVEPMVMASLVVLGLFVASRLTLSNGPGFALVGFLAVFHGLAHGMELPQNSSALAFVLGFMVTTVTLHLAGLFVGFSIRDRDRWVSRVLGAGIAGYGVLLFANL